MLFCKRLTFGCVLPLVPAPRPACFLLPWVSSTSISGRGWGGGLLARSYCCDRWGGSNAPRPAKSSMDHALQLFSVWNLGSHPHWHVLQCSVHCQLYLICVRHCVMFGDAALDVSSTGGGGASYRGCLVFVRRLCPRNGIHSKVRNCGCWCGLCGWPCGWAGVMLFW